MCRVGVRSALEQLWEGCVLPGEVVSAHRKGRADRHRAANCTRARAGCDREDSVAQEWCSLEAVVSSGVPHLAVQGNELATSLRSDAAAAAS